jgi:hypothetical protein
MTTFFCPTRQRANTDIELNPIIYLLWCGYFSRLLINYKKNPMPDSDSSRAPDSSPGLNFRSLALSPIESVEALRNRLQLALQLELARIPLYLTALYAMYDKTTEAYQTLRSVVIEKMLHIDYIAKIMVALGGTPRLTGAAMPEYPCDLPAGGLIRKIELASPSHKKFAHLFMPLDAPSYGTGTDFYGSIGQLYAAIEQGLEQLGEEIFPHAPSTKEHADFSMGKGNGSLIPNINRSSAKRIIAMLREQGEGASPPGASPPGALPLLPESHQKRKETGYAYGRRDDDTYGPLLGFPRKISHYAKFAKLAALRDRKSDKMLPALPAMQVADYADYKNPLAHRYAEFFDILYNLLLIALERSFQPGKSDLFFAVALPIMHEQMPYFGTALMRTPIHPDGDPWVGPNAAPLFRRIDDPVSKLESGIYADEQISTLVELSPPIRCLALAVRDLKEKVEKWKSELQSSTRDQDSNE